MRGGLLAAARFVAIAPMVITAGAAGGSERSAADRPEGGGGGAGGARSVEGVGSPGGPGDLGPAAAMIGGTSTCPEPEAVSAELGTLLPRERLTARLRAAAVGTAPPAEIADLGISFRVTAAGGVREYRDEARDCTYRARVAAVSVALLIDPAAVVVAPPPPEIAGPVPPPLPPAPPAAPPAPRRPRVHIQLGAAVDVGIGSDDGVAHGGAALRMALGGGPFALVVGAAALAPAETSIGGVRLRQWRLPFDVGGRVHLPGEHVQPYGELGLSAALLSERALELAVSRGGMSLALGIRAAAGLHLASSSRFAPFAALHAELVPSPPAVAALPQGIAGHTPFFWLGAVAGVSLGLL